MSSLQVKSIGFAMISHIVTQGRALSTSELRVVCADKPADTVSSRLQFMSSPKEGLMFVKCVGKTDKGVNVWDVTAEGLAAYEAALAKPASSPKEGKARKTVAEKVSAMSTDEQLAMFNGIVEALAGKGFTPAKGTDSN